MIEGFLFLDKEVFLDEQTFIVGGSWDPRGMPLGKWLFNGKPLAWEHWILEPFFQRASQIESPVVIDVGAGCGSYCLLGKHNPKMRCYAFEPNPQVFSILKKNILLNDLQKRVKSFQVALAHKEGDAILKMRNEPMSQGQGSISPLKQDYDYKDVIGINVPVNTLDHIVEEEEIEKIDMLKIDTEGCELFVLKGAKKTIEAHHPDILVEIVLCKAFGYKPEDIFDLLKSLGYNYYFRFDTDNFYFSVHKLFIKPFKDEELDKRMKPLSSRL